MEPVLLSVAYLPPISWMAFAVQSSSLEIEIHETYPKQTFRNRCNIATSSGILSLTVPVKRVNGNHTKTCDIQIDNSKNWQLMHWRSIITAYNKSPYFLFYRDLLEPLFLKKYDFLVDLNTELLNVLIKALKSNTLEFSFTAEYHTNSNFHDLRNSFHPKINFKQGISFNFPRYMQTFEENQGFIPDLSIIDLIFNLGPDALSYLLKVELLIRE